MYRSSKMNQERVSILKEIGKPSNSSNFIDKYESNENNLFKLTNHEVYDDEQDYYYDEYDNNDHYVQNYDENASDGSSINPIENNHKKSIVRYLPDINLKEVINYLLNLY